MGMLLSRLHYYKYTQTPLIHVCNVQCTLYPSNGKGYSGMSLLNNIQQCKEICMCTCNALVISN